jgi:hypothetical protein
MQFASADALKRRQAVDRAFDSVREGQATAVPEDITLYEAHELFLLCVECQVWTTALLLSARVARILSVADMDWMLTKMKEAPPGVSWLIWSSVEESTAPKDLGDEE